MEENRGLNEHVKYRNTYQLTIIVCIVITNHKPALSDLTLKLLK
jgi:hypothetical protein